MNSARQTSKPTQTGLPSKPSPTNKSQPPSWTIPTQRRVPVHSTLGLTPIVNVKKLREHLALSQEAFAEAYRIPIGTLRDWE